MQKHKDIENDKLSLHEGKSSINFKNCKALYTQLCL